VGFLHAKGGYVRENSDGVLPDYERFWVYNCSLMNHDFSPIVAIISASATTV